MPDPETQKLHQLCTGRVGTAHHVEETLAAPVSDAVAIDVEPGGSDAVGARAVIDVQLGGAACQA
jgi:hypothetical protein